MTKKNQHQQEEQLRNNLPLMGKVRWAELKHFVPVSRETWRKLYLADKAPRPQRLSERCTVWDCSEIHAWLSNPANFSFSMGV